MEQRWSKLAAPNSAGESPKLPQQSAPDNANFLEFACNVSSVFSLPTFNTSGVPRAVVEQMMQQEAMRVRLHGQPAAEPPYADFFAWAGQQPAAARAQVAAERWRARRRGCPAEGCLYDCVVIDKCSRCPNVATRLRCGIRAPASQDARRLAQHGLIRARQTGQAASRKRASG